MEWGGEGGGSGWDRVQHQPRYILSCKGSFTNLPQVPLHWTWGCRGLYGLPNGRHLSLDV